MVGSRGGSTAATAILINQEKLVMANVGDSRAVLCSNGKAKQITIDRDPLKETELVESRGGFISKKPGIAESGVSFMLTYTRLSYLLLD